MTRARRPTEIPDPCRDERCQREALHPAHHVRPGPGRPIRSDDSASSASRFLEARARRRRRHARRITKLKTLQAANNRKILLGR